MRLSLKTQVSSVVALVIVVVSIISVVIFIYANDGDLAGKAIIAVFALSAFIALLSILVVNAMLERLVLGPVRGLQNSIKIASKGIPDDMVSSKAAVEIKDLSIEINKISLEIAEFNKAKDKIGQAQKMQAVETLAGGVAHDFNNILAAILGFGSLLRLKMGEGNPLVPHVDNILKASERAARLIRAMLVFSRRQDIHLQRADLNRIVKRVDKLLPDVMGEGIEIRTTCADEELMVKADSRQLEEVFMSIASNARDAMPDGGSLTIKTERFEANFGHPFIDPGTYAVISIADTGTGMDMETRRRIFDPFYSTKETGKGTGLGLSIAHGVIKQHSGEINVQSEPGKGTSFNIYLRLAGLEAGMGAESRNALPAGGIES